jgi:hypothetical protein
MHALVAGHAVAAALWLIADMDSGCTVGPEEVTCLVRGTAANTNIRPTGRQHCLPAHHAHHKAAELS